MIQVISYLIELNWRHILRDQDIHSRRKNKYYEHWFYSQKIQYQCDQWYLCIEKENLIKKIKKVSLFHLIHIYFDEGSLVHNNHFLSQIDSYSSNSKYILLKQFMLENKSDFGNCTILEEYNYNFINKVYNTLTNKVNTSLLLGIK